MKLGGGADPYSEPRAPHTRQGPPPGRSGYRRPPRGSFLKRAGLVLLAGAAGLCLLFLIVFGFYYHKYAQIVDERLQNPLFEQTAKIYAAPREIRPGQRFSAAAIAANLRQAGYVEGGQSPLGNFSLSGDQISVKPGPASYHAPIGATIRADDGVVTSITEDDGTQLAAYQLEPTLITGLSDDKDRTKRRMLTYDELPQNLVNATLAIEDRRFFEHGGVNYGRLVEATLTDIRSGRKEQGASTLTMQLAKLFFLSPEKRIKRKMIQIIITLQLEHRFTKKQIFEMYANKVNLGQRGSFAIDGFGEAAHAYFGKNVGQLDLSECALLAGMIQSPSRLNPFRHAEHAMERRNLVLDSMVETGAITPDQAQRAKAEPLHLSPNSVDAGEAPFFVDLVRDRITAKYGDRDINREGLRVYTSLDPDLQRVATEAVEIGMRNVDELIAKRKTNTNQRPQVALIALNPHTGQVLALVGGRQYGESQLDHAVAKRPTGSIFKPFVYAAAFNTSLAGEKIGPNQVTFSPVTILSDEEATYNVGGQSYSPHDFHNESFGQVTARFALQMSLNRATISLASMVGFNTVASLARDAGIKSARGTPSVAIGTYDATPLDMAGAYTVFANGGTHVEPILLASVRDTNGEVIDDFTPQTKSVLDPRVAYLTTTLLQNVINAGTGAEVRRRGFSAPAAGKTGTSHDAWFAGYTSNLLCIVWVGNDDYSDVELQGAQAAAPIWAEFMKRAIALPQYSDAKPFAAPSGVVQVTLDKQTNLLANDTCPEDYSATFLDGTQPTQSCDQAPADGSMQNMLALGGGQIPSGGGDGNAPVVVNTSPHLGQGTLGDYADGVAPPTPPPVKKKNFIQRLFGSRDNSTPPPPPPQQPKQQNDE